MSIPVREYVAPSLFAIVEVLEGVLDDLRVNGVTIEHVEQLREGIEHSLELTDAYDEETGEAIAAQVVEGRYNRYTRITVGVSGATEISFDLPTLPGLTCVIAPGDSATEFGIVFEVNTDTITVSATVDLRLRFDPSLLIAARRIDDGSVVRFERDESAEPIEVRVGRVVLRAGESGLTLGAESGASLDRPVAIGDTGIYLDELAGLTVNLDGAADRPEGAPDDWRGVYFGSAALYVPDLFAGAVSVEGLGVGAGGLWGLIAWQASPGLVFDEATRRFTGSDLVGELLGFRGGVSEVGLSFIRNVPSRGTVEGAFLLPFFEAPIKLSITVSATGSFAITALGEDAGALATLERPDLLQLEVASLTAEEEGDRVIVWLDGRFQPLVGGLDWPGVEIDRLGIGSDGHVDIQGGWIDLPESFALDFHGFKIDLEKIGLGSDESTRRQWMGLSGGIRLIEGIPLSGSVEGLRISWDPKLPPTAAEPMRGVAVSLEGIAVHLEIPGTLVLDGAVTYRELKRPPDMRAADQTDAASAAGVFGHVFSGSITLELTALRTEVAGELLIGDLTTYRYDDAGHLKIGETFTALYIVLSAELPTAIPLGATGTGLYGAKGLFGMHVMPDRHLDAEGEPESWYAWYKADRGNGSGYDVTKVVKWAPRSDNFAFGAGITLGTVFDDGFTINAGLLAAILIPGPVVMIEGRANLLKPRGGQGGEGALYALIVFDGIAETFQMNVDVRYTLEDVITVGGGLEAFFDFNDGERWYIYIGRKDPVEKRIRAEVLSIISADAYFMVDSHGVLYGAAAGLDLQAQFGPLRLKAILRIAYELGMFRKQPQLTGKIEMYGEISIRVFGIGIGLILETKLDGSAPQPWWIHGIGRVRVRLPFPLPSFGVGIEFAWGLSGPPALVDVIKGATMVHGKLPGVSWSLPDAATAEDQWPVVPVDAIPALSLGKPISGLSRDPNGPDWFRSEVTEGVELSYALRDIVLEEKGSSGWTPRWSNPSPRLSNVRLRPDDYAIEPQVELWWYAPLDTFDRQSRRNYIDPCPGSTDPQRHCVDFRDLAEAVETRSAFRRGGLTFVPGFNQPARITKIALAPGSNQPDRGLQAMSLVVRFPEPVAWVEIRWAGNDLRFDLFLDGRRVIQAPLVSGSRMYLPLDGAPKRSLDTIQVLEHTQPPYPIVQSICYITQREMDAAARRGGSVDRTRMRSELILKPHTTYRLRATGVRIVRTVGEDGPGLDALQEVAWGFRTGGLPGTDYAALPQGVSTPVPDFAEGPLNRVGTYVKRTVPAAGAPLFYRGYDVLIELADPYATAMLSPSVTVRVLDRNGQILATSATVTLTSPFPFLTEGLLTLLTAPREDACAAMPVPWTRKVIDRFIACRLPDDARPRRMVRIELVAKPPYGTRPVFGFELSTSAFRNIADHLGSGLESVSVDDTGALRGVLNVRLLGSGAAPSMTWVAGLRARLDRQSSVREALAAALTIGEHDAGTTIVAASAELITLAADLAELYRGLYEALDRGGSFTVPATPTDAMPRVAVTEAVAVTSPGIHALFAAADLGHRPLPPRVIEALAIDVPGGYYLLIESPEPLDRARLSVERLDTGARLPLVWSADGTRVFVFHDGATGLFGPTAPSLRWKFLRGGMSAPDLDPLYRDGDLKEVEYVTWDLVGF